MAIGDLKVTYGTNTSMTLTTTTMSNATYRQGPVIDNSSDKYVDALVQLTVVPATSGTGSTGHIIAFAYGTVDGGTTYPDNVTGTAGDLTPYSPVGLVPIGVIPCNANSGTQASFKSNPMSVARAFGGILPQKWGIVYMNLSGATLPASSISASYQGIYGNEQLS